MKAPLIVWLHKHKFAIVSVICFAQWLWIFSVRASRRDCIPLSQLASLNLNADNVKPGGLASPIGPDTPTTTPPVISPRLLRETHAKPTAATKTKDKERDSAETQSNGNIQITNTNTNTPSPAPSAATTKRSAPPAALLTTFRVANLRDLPWSGVNHEDSNVRKQVLARNGEIAHVTQIARAVFPPASYTELHTHEDMSEVFFFIEGQGRAQLGIRPSHDTARAPSTDVQIKPGTCVIAPPLTAHAIVNNGTEPLIMFYFGVQK